MATEDLQLSTGVFTLHPKPIIFSDAFHWSRILFPQSRILYLQSRILLCLQPRILFRYSITISIAENIISIFDNYFDSRKYYFDGREYYFDGREYYMCMVGQLGNFISILENNYTEPGLEVRHRQNVYSKVKAKRQKLECSVCHMAFDSDYTMRNTIMK